MHAHTIPRVIAAGAVLAAAALVLLTRTPSGDLPSVAPSLDVAVLPEPVEDTAIDTSRPVAATVVETKIRELEAMSETFRNSTFLIAIRDAGFVCNELLRVYGGVDGAAKWMATCSEMLAYTVGVASDGELHVEPFEQYFDGVGPRVIEQRFDSPPQPAQPIRPPR